LELNGVLSFNYLNTFAVKHFQIMQHSQVDFVSQLALSLAATTANDNHLR